MRKWASRIVSELKDKIPMAMANMKGVETNNGEPVSSVQQDAISALVNLGYSVIQAGEAVRKALENNDGNSAVEKNIDSGTLIRLALRELSR